MGTGTGPALAAKHILGECPFPLRTGDLIETCQAEGIIEIESFSESQVGLASYVLRPVALRVWARHHHKAGSVPEDIQLPPSGIELEAKSHAVLVIRESVILPPGS